jgi:uncharacterized protein YgbK (DUF1537 family)
VAQLESARAAGWAVMPLVASEHDGADEARDRVVELLASGLDVALSAHDADFSGVDPAEALGAIAAAAADVVRAAVTSGATSRVIVSGGDTSSRVVRLLGVRSLAIAANPWGNVVILTADAPGSAVDGVELLLKGGQVGDDDLLVRVRELGG